MTDGIFSTHLTPADTLSVVTKRNGETEENKKQTQSKENMIFDCSFGFLWFCLYLEDSGKKKSKRHQSEQADK